MYLWRNLPIGLACWLLLGNVAPGRADEPLDPLRLVPAQATAFVKVEQPRKLATLVYDHDLVKELLKIDAVRELYDTTNSRRFTQLLAYFEKQLGHSYLDLLDRLAGGGIVVAANFSGDKPAALVVIQGKDEELLKKFVTLALDVVDQELARQEIKDRPKKTTYRNVSVVRLAKEAYLAQAGSALLLASDGKFLQAGIDLHQDGKNNILGVAGLTGARGLLPSQPLAWAWVNLDTVRKIPAVKTTLDTIQADPQNTFILGGAFDIFLRAPFAGAGIYQQGTDYLATVRLGAGRQGMGASAAMFVPKDQRGSLPLLEPRHVLASSSYFLDVGQFWDQRAKLLNKEQLKILEEFNENSGRFLGGIKLNTLLKQAGPHQRVVAVQQTKTSYPKVPSTKIPGFAIAVEMREPAFAQNLETVLRAAFIFGSTQFKFKMKEEKQGDITIVSYRFPDDLKSQADNIEFNFSPSFTAVGNQFILSSTVELARELVELIQKEKDLKYSPSISRTHFYGAGAAALLRGFEDQLLAQAILGQGVPLGTAKNQVEAVIRIVEQLGSLQLEEHYGASDFRYDLLWKRGK